MDAVLLEYLRSGSAWVLVGSGPSIEMGYPSWQTLAAKAVDLAEREGSSPTSRFTIPLATQAFPEVFETVEQELGAPRMLQALRTSMVGTARGRVYEYLARWPIPVYLTTNYDDEIAAHLAAARLHYQTYRNSPEHMALLHPSLRNAIFKLHGDLTTPEGLILTSSQYRDLERSSAWDHWRTKMLAVFQMHPVVIIGHSLTDPHIRSILEAAKRGSSITQPVCWLAPDVQTREARRYLDQFRIRVIGYPGGLDQHRGLHTLIKDVSAFVPPRESVRIASQIAAVVDEGAAPAPAVTAVFVFNRLAPHVNPVDLPVGVALAALDSFVAARRDDGPFALVEALEAAGWQTQPTRSVDFMTRFEREALASGVVAPHSDGLVAPGPNAQAARDMRAAFDHLRTSFLQSVQRRLEDECPTAGAFDSAALAADLSNALTGFFRQGGLTLATVLFSTNDAHVTVPPSIVSFINQASARYDTLAARRAFSHVALEIFTDSGDAEREYLGRLALGFFAFHALGTFGDAALERLRRARETVWLIDSNSLIPLLALAAPSNAAFVECFNRLKSAHVRCLSLTSLFEEAAEHLAYASNIADRVGSDSPYLIAAATGQAPYRRQNQFLQGFIRWRDAGLGDDWLAYVYAIFRTRVPTRDDIRRRFMELGVEVVDFSSWPGFAPLDYVEQEDAQAALRDLMTNTGSATDEDYQRWLSDKLPPEAEALVVVRKERQGGYHLLSGRGAKSPAFFISSTSLINAVPGTDVRVTWQPEAFLAFVSTLITDGAPASADRVFEVLVWSIASSGANPIPERTIERVFATVIDQATIDGGEQEQAYDQQLSEKYGESYEAVLRRLPPSRRLLGPLQLSNEVIQAQEVAVATAQANEQVAAKRAREAEADAQSLEAYRNRKLRKQAEVTANRRKKANKGGKKAK